ncbi:dCTP deaminase [Candidatus Woesearchaeota archaeon]|nr:dCTP deaminase [Candidatus Woesearchaeota archaeon]
MSILTGNEILKAMKKGKIKISPFSPEQLGPASVDLTLGNKFRVFKKLKGVPDINDSFDYRQLSDPVTSDSIIIKPQETVLAITKERITLADDICGWLEGRSKFARMGLLVHISAPFMQPGIDNYPVLEISNMGKNPVQLHAGTRICQFIFEKSEGKAKYVGRFSQQTEP